jgi:ankyrin repeat protein
MLLLDLPNELLQSLAEALELERHINAFTQTNRRLYNLLNTYLYRHNVHQLGSSALLWAAERGQKATVQKLLKEGANTDIISVEE